MKMTTFAYMLVSALLTLVIAGCGGDDGAAPLSATASKPIAFNNGTDTVDVTFSFPNDVTTPQTVRFNGGGKAFLSISSAVVPKGFRSTTVAISSTTKGPVTVSASGGGHAGSKTVKFVDVVPTRAELSIALNVPVAAPGLANLFTRVNVNGDLTNTAVIADNPQTPANDPAVLLNEALTTPGTSIFTPVPGGLLDGDVMIVNNNSPPPGLVTTANSPLIKVNYAVTCTTLVPSFSVQLTKLLSAQPPNLELPVFDFNVVLSADYFDAANNKLN